MATKVKEIDLEKEKLAIINWITTLDDDSAIEKLRIFRDNQAKTDWGMKSLMKKRMLLIRDLKI